MEDPEENLLEFGSLSTSSISGPKSASISRSTKAQLFGEAFGRAFRTVTCALKRTGSEGCLLRRKRAYGYVFFTRPALANQMLDLLPADAWRAPDAAFRDPCCKSGILLRDIAERLDKAREAKD